ncbi:unnamed protein product, partial [Ectocarpus sp. 4 AP-2014]
RYYGGARFEPLSRKRRSSGGAVAAAAAARGAGASSEGSVSTAGDMGEPSPCWRAYGGHWLVLPQVELCSVAAAQAAGGRPAAILAVNLRWTDPERSTTTPAVASTGNTTAVRNGKGGVGGERRADVGEERPAAAGSGASDVGSPAPAPSEASSTATTASTGSATAAIGVVGGYGCERDRQR